MPDYFLIVEYQSGGASIHRITAEDIYHAAVVARSILREKSSVKQSFVAPQTACVPIYVTRPEDHHQ